MTPKVRNRRPGHTRLSGKFQLNVPRAAAREAGLEVGDELRVEAVGKGRLMVIRGSSAVEELAEIGRRLEIHYPAGYLRDVRADWE